MKYRYRLQRKVTWALPNTLGNKSMPVYSWHWEDIAVSDDLDALRKYKTHIISDTRIIDTENFEKVVE